jgi:hypothetical protein
MDQVPAAAWSGRRRYAEWAAAGDCWSSQIAVPRSNMLGETESAVTSCPVHLSTLRIDVRISFDGGR